MNYLKNIISTFKSRQVKLTGCTVDEIDEIKSLVTNNLPDCYIEFLELMGKDIEENYEKPDYYEYGNFSGENVFYPTIKMLNIEDKNGLLEEDERPDLYLSDNDFVFLDHQGYIFFYFKLNEGNNPPVYGYEEGMVVDEIPKVAKSLSEFYESYLDGSFQFPSKV